MRMPSLLGQCSDCCVLPMAYAIGKIRTASASKCGFRAYGQTGPTYTYYKTETLSGSKTSIYCFGVPNETCTYSGSEVYDPEEQPCTITNTKQVTSTSEPCSISLDGQSTVTTTATTVTYAPKASDCPYSDGSTGTVTRTLSGEYTTSELITRVEADLAAADWIEPRVPTALRAFDDLSEKSYLLGDAVYSVRFQASARGPCIISWVERFYPEGGGTPTDTVKSYSWDGTIPSGYDANDDTTWPTSGDFTLPPPATDGYIITECFTATYTGSVPADPCNP